MDASSAAPTKAYAAAGVDIAAAEAAKARLKAQLRRATRPEVLGTIGAFGGFFDISALPYRQPVLVASTDGVGTKLKLAFATGRHRGIGHDIVNHCLNDIAVTGAAGLFFLDYFASGKLEPAVFHEVLEGMAEACAAAGCALIGGETAQMAGFYAAGEYDIAGTIVGAVEKSRILSGATVQPGDVVLGVASSGLHTNGYTLARKLLLETWQLPLDGPLPGGTPGQTLADALLEPHRDYSRLLLGLLERHNTAPQGFAERPGNAVFGAAHITGGGFVGNIPRQLPAGCRTVIDLAAWPVPPIFRLLASRGAVAIDELYEVFNMGIGLVLVVRAEAAATLLADIHQQGVAAWAIGTVQAGEHGVELTGQATL